MKVPTTLEDWRSWRQDCFTSCEHDNTVYLRSTISSHPKAPSGCTDPRDRFRERAAWVQASQDASSPFTPLAPNKCGHSVTSKTHITCLKALLKPAMFLQSCPLSAFWGKGKLSQLPSTYSAEVCGVIQSSISVYSTHSSQ